LLDAASSISQALQPPADTLRRAKDLRKLRGKRKSNAGIDLDPGLTTSLSRESAAIRKFAEKLICSGYALLHAPQKMHFPKSSPFTEKALLGHTLFNKFRSAFSRITGKPGKAGSIFAFRGSGIA
jgi:hypothetical protein